MYKNFVISIDSGIYEHFGYKEYYNIKGKIKSIISYLYNNQIFNNNTSGYLNINISYDDDIYSRDKVVITTTINEIYKSSIEEKFEGVFILIKMDLI